MSDNNKDNKNQDKRSQEADFITEQEQKAKKELKKLETERENIAKEEARIKLAKEQEELRKKAAKEKEKQRIAKQKAKAEKEAAKKAKKKEQEIARAKKAKAEQVAKRKEAEEREKRSKQLEIDRLRDAEQREKAQQKEELARKRVQEEIAKKKLEKKQEKELAKIKLAKQKEEEKKEALRLEAAEKKRKQKEAEKKAKRLKKEEEVRAKAKAKAEALRLKEEEKIRKQKEAEKKAREAAKEAEIRAKEKARIEAQKAKEKARIDAQKAKEAQKQAAIDANPEKHIRKEERKEWRELKSDIKEVSRVEKLTFRAKKNKIIDEEREEKEELKQIIREGEEKTREIRIEFKEKDTLLKEKELLLYTQKEERLKQKQAREEKAAKIQTEKNKKQSIKLQERLDKLREEERQKEERRKLRLQKRRDAEKEKERLAVQKEHEARQREEARLQKIKEERVAARNARDRAARIFRQNKEKERIRISRLAKQQKEAEWEKQQKVIRKSRNVINEAKKNEIVTINQIENNEERLKRQLKEAERERNNLIKQIKSDNRRIKKLSKDPMTRAQKKRAIISGSVVALLGLGLGLGYWINWNPEEPYWSDRDDFPNDVKVIEQIEARKANLKVEDDKLEDFPIDEGSRLNTEFFLKTTADYILDETSKSIANSHPVLAGVSIDDDAEYSGNIDKLKTNSPESTNINDWYFEGTISNLKFGIDFKKEDDWNNTTPDIPNPPFLEEQDIVGKVNWITTIKKIDFIVEINPATHNPVNLLIDLKDLKTTINDTDTQRWNHDGTNDEFFPDIWTNITDEEDVLEGLVSTSNLKMTQSSSRIVVSQLDEAQTANSSPKNDDYIISVTDNFRQTIDWTLEVDKTGFPPPNVKEDWERLEGEHRIINNQTARRTILRQEQKADNAAIVDSWAYDFRSEMKDDAKDVENLTMFKSYTLYNELIRGQFVTDEIDAEEIENVKAMHLYSKYHEVSRTRSDLVVYDAKINDHSDIDEYVIVSEQP